MNADAFARALRALASLDLPDAAPPRDLDVAGTHLRLRCATPRFGGPVLRALAHHAPRDATTPPDLTVFLLDGGAVAPPFADLLAGAPRADDDPSRIERWSYEGESGRALLQGSPRTLYLWHRASGRAAWCVEDARDLPYYQVALPLLPILGWCLAGRGLAIVHAAAIASEDGALLVAGRSGSGKTTAALACLEAAWGYLGDDVCVVAPGSPPTVHALYGSAKLEPGDEGRFPTLAPARVVTGGFDRAKTVFLFDRHLAARIVRSAPVRGIVFPRRGDAEPAVAQSAGRAFLAMAPNTVFLLPGAARAAADGVKSLVTRVPAHAVGVGATVDAIPRRLRDHLRALAARVPDGATPR